MVGKLAAKACHFDRLALADSAYVDAGRGGNEYVDVARAVVDDDDESERQIVDNRLRDRPGDADQTAFSPFTHATSCYRQRVNFRSTTVRLGDSDVDEHKQTGQHGIGECACDAHLLPRRKAEV